ncbi:MAG: hypothetical protein JST01_07375 [Cyanobacteria bacterium SZAS TMP-1]|nr:hypothetical protein [Cyanobacteria bacterium SZAS TMP-1]
MSNSVSPLLTEVDVLPHPHSILTLEFDEVSDIVFHLGRIWFMWYVRPSASDFSTHSSKLSGKHSGRLPGKLGLASCEIDEQGKLGALRKWPLPLPPTCIPTESTAQSPEFQIATIAGSDLVVLITLKHQSKTYWGGADSAVFSFSPHIERWNLGAYGKVTKKFRFHPIEKPQDISLDIFSSATISDTIMLYTLDEQVCGHFDTTEYHSDDWHRTPEQLAFLNSILEQKMEMLEPNAAAFIFLNNGVPFDQQISEPAGGKTIFLPGFERRVVLLYNYEPVIAQSDSILSQSGSVKYKFKWPGLAIERDQDFDIAFAVSHNMGAAWHTALINMRLPIALLRDSSIIHVCQKDMFGCVYGFCKSAL